MDNKPEQQHQMKQKSPILKWGLPLLAISVGVAGYQYYQSRIGYLSGYGDDDAIMAMLAEKPAKSLSGGDLTHFKFGNISFETEAYNLPWQLAAQFDAGDGVFERPYSKALKSGFRYEADGLGPLFNAASCEGCHIADGRAAPPEYSGQPLAGMLFRVSVPGTDPHGGPNPHPIYGGQLADKAVNGHKPEITYAIEYQTISGQFADGESWELKKPIYSFPEQNYGPLGDDAMTSARIAPHMIGMGLLDAIDDRDILSRADADDKDGDGISGKPNMVWSVEYKDYRVGKYGWKAETPTLAHQSMDAAANDMGVTNPLFPTETCTAEQSQCQNALSGITDDSVEMTAQQMDDVVAYLEFLAVPGRGHLDHPQVIRGEQLFNDAGCESCHRASYTTGTSQRQRRLHNQKISPYTDLLLHDMGPLLADHRPSFDADGYEWRTAPLWGIGLVERVNGHTRFMHDGRARNLSEAILWHGGEAEQAKQKYMAMAKADRNALIKFLKSI